MKPKKIIQFSMASLLVIGGSGITTAADEVSVYPEKEVFFGTTQSHG